MALGRRSINVMLLGTWKERTALPDKEKVDLKGFLSRTEPILGGGRASEEEKGPDTLMDILGGINPAGMRSFER